MCSCKIPFISSLRPSLNRMLIVWPWLNCFHNFIDITIATYPNAGLTTSAELASIMGSDCTPNGIRFQISDRYRPVAKRQLEMKASGQDPKDVLDHVKGAHASRGQIFIFSFLCYRLYHFTLHHTDILRHQQILRQ